MRYTEDTSALWSTHSFPTFLQKSVVWLARLIHTDDGHTVIVAGQTVASGVGRAADGTERRRGQGYQKLDDTADIELRSGQMGFGAHVVR